MFGDLSIPGNCGLYFQGSIEVRPRVNNWGTVTRSRSHGNLCWSRDLEGFFHWTGNNGWGWKRRMCPCQIQAESRIQEQCMWNEQESGLRSWQPQERLKIISCACPLCFFSDGKIWKWLVPEAHSGICSLHLFCGWCISLIKSGKEEIPIPEVLHTSVRAWRPWPGRAG